MDRSSAGKWVEVMEAAIDEPHARTVDQPSDPDRMLSIDLDGITMSDFHDKFPRYLGWTTVRWKTMKIGPHQRAPLLLPRPAADGRHVGVLP